MALVLVAAAACVRSVHVPCPPCATTTTATTTDDDDDDMQSSSSLPTKGFGITRRNCRPAGRPLPAGWLHPTINLSDPEAGVNPTRVVAGTKQHHPINVALSNSFGFGGHNSCIMFKAHTA